MVLAPAQPLRKVPSPSLPGAPAELLCRPDPLLALSQVWVFPARLVCEELRLQDGQLLSEMGLIS